jgi:hypothetical protein
LLFQNERIWGLDKDNRIGWHIHPFISPAWSKPHSEFALPRRKDKHNYLFIDVNLRNIWVLLTLFPKKIH